MASPHHRLTTQSFERLREQLAAAAALCAEDQLLDLADGLHDSLRRRREQRHRLTSGGAPADGPSAHALQ